MPGLEKFTNPYDRRAKLYPMVITLLPLALGLAAWSPPQFRIQGVLASALVAVAAAALLTQLARDQGKKREPSLFRQWGGRPSDRALSYAGGVYPAPTLARRHRALSKMDPKLKFPKSSEAELATPEAWLPVYASATDLLLAKTRDHGKFALLFQENINYGYRRNLWGMKPAGILACLVGLAASGTHLTLDLLADRSPSSAAIAGAGVCIVLLVLWCLRVTPSWVRIPADAYAKHLAECCDRIGEPAS